MKQLSSAEKPSSSGWLSETQDTTVVISIVVAAVTKAASASLRRFRNLHDVDYTASHVATSRVFHCCSMDMLGSVPRLSNIIYCSSS